MRFRIPRLNLFDASTVQDKQCNICHRCFPLTTEYFNAKSTAADGLTKTCSACLDSQQRLAKREAKAIQRAARQQQQAKLSEARGLRRQQRKEALLAEPLRLPKKRVNESGQVELRCGHCKQWFPATEECFYVNKSKTLGLSGNCRACHLAMVARTPSKKDSTYRSPTEKRLEQEASDRQQEREIERARKREQQERLRQETEQKNRAAKAEKLAAADRLRVVRDHLKQERHQRALEKRRVMRRAVEKRYRQSPKGKRVLQVGTQRKRARKQSLPNTLTTAQWATCLNYFGHRCAVCGQPAGMFTTLAQDHWIPLAYKGADNPGTVVTNIIPLCHSLEQGMMGCNNCKREKNAHEWLVSTYGARKAKQIEARINAYFDSVRRFEAVS